MCSYSVVCASCSSSSTQLYNAVTAQWTSALIPTIRTLRETLPLTAAWCVGTSSHRQHSTWSRGSARSRFRSNYSWHRWQPAPAPRPRPPALHSQAWSGGLSWLLPETVNCHLIIITLAGRRTPTTLDKTRTHFLQMAATYLIRGELEFCNFYIFYILLLWPWIYIMDAQVGLKTIARE